MAKYQEMCLVVEPGFPSREHTSENSHALTNAISSHGLSRGRGADWGVSHPVGGVRHHGVYLTGCDIFQDVSTVTMIDGRVFILIVGVNHEGK